MNTNMLRRVRKMFSSDMVPISTNRRNQREWVRAVRRLGDRWIAIPNSSGRE